MNENTIDQDLMLKSSVRPNDQRAKVAVALIIVVMIADIISLISSYMQYDLIVTFQSGGDITYNDLESNDMREQTVGVLNFIVNVISAVTFIMWFRRAYYNLGIRTKREYDEYWTIWGWIIPIISLFRPYQIMRELWDKTSSIAREKAVEVKTNNVVMIMGFWWTLWIITNIIGNYVTRTAFDSEDINDIMNATKGDIIFSITGIILALITISMIRNYDKKESALYENDKNEALAENTL